MVEQMQRVKCSAWVAIIGVVAAFVVVSARVDAMGLSLAWDLPTHYADGTPLTDLAGCRVYYGTDSRQYSQMVDISNGVSQCNITGLDTTTTYFFAVTAYDDELRESGYSAEMVWSAAPPHDGELGVDAGGDQSVRVNHSVQSVVTTTYSGDTPPSLTMMSGPNSAGFIDHGDGSGDFTWTPEAGDVGEHVVSFVATGGELSATSAVTINVSSAMLTAPLSSSVCRAGAPLVIRWTGAWPLESVNIELWQGTNLVTVLTNGLAAPLADMSWETSVPQGVIPSNDYWIYVEDADAPVDTMLSDLFTVRPPCKSDFDGDGQSDLGCYYAPGGNWYIDGSTEGVYTTTFGYAGTLPIVGDFDGDGKSDIGCYYAPDGSWYIDQSTEGVYTTSFGYAGTVPIVGDFDGDGRDDFGCYYAPGGNWYIFKSTEGFYTTTFGYAGTTPIVGDFDGDGRDDFGCYYAPGGNWYIYKSTEGFYATTFGYAGTTPIVGDFDGDGRDDFGCYYAPGGNWYIYKSSEGFYATTFGYAGAVPVTGDFDGDGRDDFGCYYAPGGNWYIYKSAEGFYTTTFGYAGTVPLGH